jgi:hypothetical protein
VVVAALEVVVGVVVVVDVVAVVPSFVPVAEDESSDEALVVDVVAFTPVADPLFVLVVATTALDVVPGISAATTVAMPAVPTTAARVTAVVVRRIRRATNRRPVSFSGLPVSRPAMAPSFRWCAFDGAFDGAFAVFNDGGLSAPCGAAEPRL